MPEFLSLPPELIFHVYCSLDSIGDAYFLSQTSKQTYYIVSQQKSQPKIFDAIIDNITQDPAPAQAWLEAQFGPGSLWQPTEATPPVDLTDDETLEFLLDVGFPLVNLPRVGFNSIFLRQFVDEEQRFYGCTLDDLYIMFHPEERDELPVLSLCFGVISSQLVMLNNNNGIIYFYDLLGGLYMNCVRGIIAYVPDTFVVLLGMVVVVTKDLCKVSPDVSQRNFKRGVEVLMNSLDVQRKKLGDYDFAVDYYSEFWDDVFDNSLGGRRGFGLYVFNGFAGMSE
ncbi:hypothetical protein BDV38DRAFT_282400 [Aspergillus pseudotamarii]|uniref:F-box domain-containing protein n=1 Tax=Aspergillus pseudotamarii TaxID=132259 RepID=A0A5N6SWE6_ASPPS|nr:uncharacterized protein BDV38DRAFT_282400 [Aspergillus pseudotamarii]KAE8138101.1 hypothetical protein BDV38DRAFT_282400 [Aspergillus pseudotamarii]